MFTPTNLGRNLDKLECKKNSMISDQREKSRFSQKENRSRLVSNGCFNSKGNHRVVSLCSWKWLFSFWAANGSRSLFACLLLAAQAKRINTFMWARHLRCTNQNTHRLEGQRQSCFYRKHHSFHGSTHSHGHNQCCRCFVPMMGCYGLCPLFCLITAL